MLITLPVISLVELTGLVVGGVPLARTWVLSPAVLWASALPFAVLGVLVGFVASSETAYPLVTALMFLLSFFGACSPRALPSPCPASVAAFLPSSTTPLSVGGGGRPAPGLADAAILLATPSPRLAVTSRHRAEESRAFAPNHSSLLP